MDRRQLLKGLAALPLARLNYAYGAPSICSGTCNPVQNSLLVWLEGAFAVVLNHDGQGHPIVTAFSPADTDHLVNITFGNGEEIKGAYPEQFHLNLPSKGVKAATTACISSEFKDFCVDHLGNIVGSPENAFVRVRMPLPKNIYTTHLFQATLANGGSAFLPQDHVFEYETVSGQPITLDYEDKNQLLSPNANNVFRIEVGLSKGSSNAIDHAKHFHNKAILAHFGLQNDPGKQITNIGTSLKCPTAPEKILTKLAFACPRDTTTLECKSGGLIGGSP